MVRFQIPDEALDYLRTLSENDSQCQWEIGDLLVDVWDELKVSLPENELRNAHAQMIRQFAKASGLAPATLRDRENVCRFFEPADRSLLSYHQHRAIKSAGTDWERWMDWALDNMASVDDIRKAIDAEENPAPAWQRKLERIKADAERAFADPETPDEKKAGFGLIISVAEDNLYF